MFKITSVVALMVVFALNLFASNGFACTTVLISGRSTVDGRPLLWKNRDTWQNQNEVLYDDSGKYALIGVVNAEATKSIWMGVNETGFCIENSLSKDLLGSQGTRGGMGNGMLIRRALETCASSDEFEQLLNKTNSPGRRTQGNFGVIDAQGNAVMFEVGPDGFLKFDANDPRVAPEGIIVRANTSITGATSKQNPAKQNPAKQEPSNNDPPANDTPASQAITLVANASVLESRYSGLRYCRAKELCLSRLKNTKIDIRFMLQDVARDIQVLNEGSDSSSELVSTARTINRNTTVSAAVFQGVLPGESATGTTMWTLLGEPAFSIAVPNWVAQKKVAKPLNGIGSSSICDLSVRLRQRNYLAGSQRSGDLLMANHVKQIRLQTLAVEDHTIDELDRLRGQLCHEQPSSDQFWQLHQDAADRAHAKLKHLCQIIKAPVGRFSSSAKLATDFQFDDPDGTKLGEAYNSSDHADFDGGLSDCVTHQGSFRIRRNDQRSVNRFVDVTPNVRVSSDDQGAPKVPRGWIVMEIAQWNLLGDEVGETIRIGFASQPAKDIHTVGLQIRRVDQDKVTVRGIGFGDGSTDINADMIWPAKQTQKIEFAIQLDKVTGNSGEGDSGGAYQIYYRDQNHKTFQPLGQRGKARRLRNGNSLALHVEGNFGDEGEFFDVDRIYYATSQP